MPPCRLSGHEIQLIARGVPQTPFGTLIAPHNRKLIISHNLSLIGPMQLAEPLPSLRNIFSVFLALTNKKRREER
jgi:hypothetical protein